MILAPSQNDGESPPAETHLKSYFYVGILDLIGNILTVIGLTLCGSGIFQVVYSSVVLFGALFSKYLLGKNLNRNQWIGLFIITSGLSLSALGTSSSSSNDKQMLGIFLTLCGTMLYGLSYVISEKTLTSQNGPSANQLQVYSSFVGLAFLFTYFLVYVSPNWKELFTTPVMEKGGDMQTILFLYAALLISGFVHSFAYFKIICTLGTVTTGVLQAIRAISVFLLSSYLFCSTNSDQCMNLYKAASAIAVSVGVVYYSRSEDKIDEEKILA